MFFISCFFLPDLPGEVPENLLELFL